MKERNYKMTKPEIIELLNKDLLNEYKHMHFYLYASITVQGLHRMELAEMFEEHAKEEMNHVREFSKVILGLGGIPVSGPLEFFNYNSNPASLLTYAMNMELEVVENYYDRILDAERLDSSEGKFLEIFLEDQLMHSKSDADEFLQILKNI